MKAATFLALALLVAQAVWPGDGAAQQIFLDPNISNRVFSVRCVGSIDDKHLFNDVRAEVTVSHNAPERSNPLLILIVAQPTLAAKNSFYWNSDFTDLAVGADVLRSTLKPTYTKPSDISFYYMSPALYRSPQALTHREAERVRWVDEHAKPIHITATQGELTLKIQGNRVVGSLWMTGYDQLGNRPVRYVVRFEGAEYVQIKPKR